MNGTNAKPSPPRQGPVQRMLVGNLLNLAAGSNPRDRIMVLAMANAEAAKFLQQDIESNATLLSDIKYLVRNKVTGKMEETDLTPQDYGLIAAGDIDAMSSTLQMALINKGFNLEIIRRNNPDGKATRRAAMKAFAGKGDVIEQQQWLDAGYAADIQDPYERRAAADALSEGVLGKALGGTYLHAQLTKGEIQGPGRTQLRTAERVLGVWDASGSEIRDEKLVADTLATLNAAIEGDNEMVGDNKRKTRDAASQARRQIKKIAQEIMSSLNLPKLSPAVLAVLQRGGIGVMLGDGQGGASNVPASDAGFDASRPGQPPKLIRDLQKDPRALRDGSTDSKVMFKRNRIRDIKFDIARSTLSRLVA